MALTAKLAGKYRKPNTGTNVFRYLVSGTEKELQEFKDAQGDNFREDTETGKPMWFTTRYASDNVDLIITTNGQVVADDTEFAKVQSLVDQYGPEVAKLIMAQQKPL